MLLLDLNQVMIANLFAQLKGHHETKLEENLLRHMIVNKLRNIKNQFHDEYGRLIICTDAKNVWRREVFPYYKAGRRENRDKDELDWGLIFATLNKIREEINEYFPFKVISVDTAEADDIIGTIAHMKGNHLNVGEKVLILSSDKDYIQLHVYGNVEQFDPVMKRWIKHSDPENYLTEHVFKGDRGDGIPNVLSPGNCFVAGIRQKPVTKKRMEKWKKGEELDDDLIKNIARNKQLIDLSQVPQSLKNKIVEEFEKPNDKNCSRLFEYFSKNRMSLMMEHITDFKEKKEQ